LIHFYSACRFISVLVLLLALQACSWFGDDEEEESREPVELTAFNKEVNLHKLWTHNVGDDAEDSQTGFRPGIQGSRIFGVASDGNVVALDIFSGKKIWKTELADQLESEISADNKTQFVVGGIGVSSDIVVVSLASGELVALNQSDGTVAWRAETTSEVLSPAVIQRDQVIVQSIDGKLASYDALDGHRRWIYSASIPSLTSRGTTTPVIFDKYVITGFANGRVALMGLDDGILRFEQKIAVPQGDSDLDRLVDIDGAMVMEGSLLYVVSMQGNVIALDLASGKARWGKEASSDTGLGSGLGAVYLAHSDGVLEALDKNSGETIWSVDKLKYRQLSTPVAIGSYVVVGDLEGYLHVFSQSDGRLVGRTRVDGEAVRAPVVVEGNRLYLMGNSGRLAAYEVQ